MTTLCQPSESSGKAWAEICQQLCRDIRTLQEYEQPRGGNFRAVEEVLLRHFLNSDPHFQERLRQRDWRWIRTQCHGLGKKKTGELIIQTAFGGNFPAEELRASALYIVLCQTVTSVLDARMREELAMDN